MKSETIVIPSKIDDKLFSSFAFFDTIILQKRLRSPLIFAGLMGSFACVCYALHNKADQAIFMGNVLLIIGLALPIVYFGSFFSSVQAQITRLHLRYPQHVYTVYLDGEKDGVVIADPKASSTAFRKWDDIFGAYRVKGCIYLYVTPRQAFLLPDGQANVTPDELWAFLQEKLPQDKMKNRIK